MMKKRFATCSYLRTLAKLSGTIPSEIGDLTNLTYNVVIISSIINTPGTPLSYTNTRSVFTSTDRFEQTKKTIQSIKSKIPNCIILLVECSELSGDMLEYFQTNVSIFLNVYDDDKLRTNIFSQSKSLGESTQIIHALQYIIDHMDMSNISSITKISGRYWLSDTFDYTMFENEKWIVKAIQSNEDNILTALYKLPIRYIHHYLSFLIQSHQDCVACIGLEILFARCIATIPRGDKIIVNTIGLEGYVSINGHKYLG